MTTWTQALRAAEGRVVDAHDMESYAAPATWLAAAMLDSQCSSPEHMLAGVNILVIAHDGLREAIEDLVALVFGRDAKFKPDYLRPGDMLVVRNPRATKDWAKVVSRTGCLCVVLCATSADIVAPSSVAAADDLLHVLDGVGRQTFVAACREVTGGDVVLPAGLGTLTFDEAVAVLHVGDDADTVERRLAMLVAARKPAVAEPEDAGHGRPPAARPRVTRLSEMTGFGEAATWGLNLAEDLREYRAGRLAWSDVDRGVLLSGPPGCGKTTYVKALGAECEIETVPTTYNEWSAAGSGSNDTMSKGMTTLFAKWREKAKKGPIILFIDEIDTMGRRGGNDHNESWFSSVINAWLAFLDGAVPRDGIVVVAATNHPERVDPALLRPGRLDRHVVIPAPDVSAIQGIVRHHLGPDAVVDEAELRAAARACRGMSPAEVELTCREARRAARRHFRRAVCADDVVAVLGARRLQVLSQPGAMAADRRIALHEAAHAVAVLRTGAEDLLSVDLDAGLTWSSRPPFLTLAIAEDRLVVLVAGLVAEDLLLGGHSSGAGQDLRDATSLCYDAQAAWGMGAVGLRSLAADEARRDPVVVEAVDAILTAARARARALVEESREAVERLADRLQADRYLDGAEVRALVDGPPAPRRGRRVVGPKA